MITNNSWIISNHFFCVNSFWLNRKILKINYKTTYFDIKYHMKKIVFTGGGTLGHVMPNLYLINELKGYDISYIGSNGIEKEKVSRIVKYYTIPATKFVRGKFWANFKIPFILISAIHKSKKILKKIKPNVVFSKGGYVSLPVCIAARKLKIPIIAHESDFSFGLANRIILKLCNTMCVNFKNLENTNKKIVYTGPIFSKDFENETINKSSLHLDENKPTILIVGGSLGSKKINEVIFTIHKDLIEKYNIIHITGKGNCAVKSHDNYNAFEMRNDMPNLYNISDFVIGRSGAGVTAECFFKRVPMLLIPLENGASRGDQLQNAKYYEKQGVATIMREKDLTPLSLLKLIDEIFKNKQKYIKSYEDIKTVNGKEKILQLIEKSCLDK